MDLLSPSLLYTLLRDGWSAYQAARRRLSATQIVALRQKWKPEFEEKLFEKYTNELRMDAIIRDMRRVDNYPNTAEHKGISPWFRVGLMGTYHRGILVGLSWESLTMDSRHNSWRLTNHKAGEAGDAKVILLGKIPYENIEAVDWQGDEYYGFPHIYCYFAHKKEPYEAVGYFEQHRNPGGFPFYTEICSYQEVRKLSRKVGIVR